MLPAAAKSLALPLVLLCWLGCHPARARAAAPASGPLEGAAGAAAGARPEARSQVADLLEEAYLLEAEGQGHHVDEETRQELLQRAVSVYTRVLALAPHHAEARLGLGRVLGSPELGDEALRRSVPELRRARQDDRGGALDVEIASHLGIVLSRLGRFQEAVDEYDRALLNIDGQPGSPARLRMQRATLLGNSAEALMAMGRLREAIARYALAEQTEITDQAALHTLGLAVAYDRDGQTEKSREALRRSLTTDPAMKLFQSDGVFFVPPGDRNYYIGLAAEAFGDRERAMEAWQVFLRELPRSRYAARARAHLDELRRTPGLSATELYRAEVSIGGVLFPPERSGSTTGAVLGGRLRTEEDVERVALDHRIELRQCYARALRQDANLVGELEVALVLDRYGAVALAEVMRASFSDQKTPLHRAPDAGPDLALGQVAKDLQRCAVDTVRRWRFPPSDSEHDELALPLRFEARH